MKLRNKRTGEKAEVEINYNSMLVTHEDGRIEQYYFDSLKDLEEWEDYEEPKEWWYIDIHGPHKVANNDEYYQQVKVASKEIGNYFVTKEEAEKAVEKLKAFKRLKDKGLRFCGHDDRDRGQLGDIVIYAEMSTFEYDDDSTRDDLDLLFSGEDD